MTAADRMEVVVERLIAAPPERVFAALTRADELERWFFSEVQTDPRAGGSHRMWWRSEDDPARDHERFGRYLEVEPNRKLVFEWRGAADGVYGLAEAGDTIVTITLTPEGTGTRVRVVHTGWPASDAGRALRDSHEGGWTFYADNLARYLTGGADLRSQQFKQKTRAAPQQR